MAEKNKKINEILLELAQGLNRFAQRSANFKKNWYWEYYEELESDIKDSEERRRIYQQIYHLERFGYLSKDGFSAKGLVKLFRAKKGMNERDEKWDGKWRIVIFDIPEKRRHIRNILRASLCNLGFKLLQNSIWVSPFADFDEIQKLAKKLKIERYVVLILADRISNNLLYEKKFHLN